MQIDQTTQQNAAPVEQAAASSAMSDRATRLQTVMGFFELAEMNG